MKDELKILKMKVAAMKGTGSKKAKKKPVKAQPVPEEAKKKPIKGKGKATSKEPVEAEVERSTDPKGMGKYFAEKLRIINKTVNFMRGQDKFTEDEYGAVGTLLFDRTPTEELKWSAKVLKANGMSETFKGEVEKTEQLVLDTLGLAGFFVAEKKGKQSGLKHQTGKAVAAVQPLGANKCKVAIARKS
jgi:hypothetical protein